MAPLRARKVGHTAADAAISAAEASLRRAKSRDREVTEVTTAMRRMRERNHFIEKLEGITGAIQ